MSIAADFRMQMGSNVMTDLNTILVKHFKTEAKIIIMVDFNGSNLGQLSFIKLLFQHLNVGKTTKCIYMGFSDDQRLYYSVFPVCHFNILIIIIS